MPHDFEFEKGTLFGEWLHEQMREAMHFVESVPAKHDITRSAQILRQVLLHLCRCFVWHRIRDGGICYRS